MRMLCSEAAAIQAGVEAFCDMFVFLYLRKSHVSHMTGSVTDNPDLSPTWHRHQLP